MANPADPNKIELSTRATELRQGNVLFLSFHMTATTLAELAHPNRFSLDHDRGVQRDLDEAQVQDFMDAMEAGQPIPANLTLNLTGEWVRSGEDLYGEKGQSTIEALDGQHRGEAARRWVEAGRSDITDRYTFVVMATENALDDLRRELFLAQVKALRVSREHESAVRRRAGKFNTKGEEEASVIAAALNERLDSPFSGRIHEGDVHRVGRNRKRVLPADAWATFAGVSRALVESVTGRSSIVAHLDTTGKTQFAIDLLSAAKESFRTQFEEGGTLRTAFGIKALFLLAARKQGTFRALLQANGASKAEMMRLFALVPRFQWAPRAGVNCGAVVGRFNDRLSEAIGTPPTGS